MRVPNDFNSSGTPPLPVKDDDDLHSLTELKALTYISLADCEKLIKNEFENEEDTLMNSDLVFSFASDNSSIENETFEAKKSDSARKNKRKTQTPQRAVQPKNVAEATSEGNSSECSQDASESLSLPSFINSNSVDSTDLFMSDPEFPESEDMLRDIDEEDIFKGIQEEADGEKLDDEIIDNVKEEWRAHWGVKCNMCEKVFPFRSEFDNHYIENYKTMPIYTCSFCNKSAEKYSTFRSHCYRHITEGRYKCKVCNKGFSLQSMLQVHIIAKHSKSKPFTCEECGKSFVTKPGLKIHLKKHKTETKEDYPCLICGKVLHTRGGLTSHINVHRLGRRFMCDICGKTFTQKVNMQQHAKQHTGDKPYACDKCNKTFAEKSHLARHYSFHSNQRPFKCEVCQKMYKTERCLKVHSMVHASERPFVCVYCSKGFLSSTKLKQHYNVHTGERPYACKYCERTFTNYPNWLKHTRRRHRVDHKTGEELPPKPVKNEAVETPITIPEQISSIPLQNIDVSDTITTDFRLSKTEELLLQQQGLLNFPLTDDKLILQPDFITDPSSNNTNIIVPNFQIPMLPSNQHLLQNTSDLSLNLQFDFTSNQFLHQPLSCD